MPPRILQIKPQLIVWKSIAFVRMHGGSIIVFANSRAGKRFDNTNLSSDPSLTKSLTELELFELNLQLSLSISIIIGYAKFC